jgi:hypothetical protein
MRGIFAYRDKESAYIPLAEKLKVASALSAHKTARWKKSAEKAFQEP